jgi:hypothetical protein
VQKCKGGGGIFGWRVAASGGGWRAASESMEYRVWSIGRNSSRCEGRGARPRQTADQGWSALPEAGGFIFQVSDLGGREPGTGVRVRVQVRDLNLPGTWDLYLNTRARDLRAETWDLKMGVMSAGNFPVSGLPWGWGYGGRGATVSRPRQTADQGWSALPEATMS